VIQQYIPKNDVQWEGSSDITDQVKVKYAGHKSRRDVGKVAIAIAKYTYFGSTVPAESTMRLGYS